MKLELRIQEILDVCSAELLSGNKNAIVNRVDIDSRDVYLPDQTAFICLKGNKTDGHQFIASLYEQGCRTFIVSERTSELEDANLILVKNALQALQEIAAYHRSKFDLPVIGITGSNGKTIVKEWIYELLKDEYSIVRSPKSYNSQIGVALSVLQIRKEHDLALFEAGISLHGEMDRLEKMIQPTIGVFTGIGKAHHTGFESMEQKITEKFKLFQNCSKVVCNEEFETYATSPVLSWSNEDIEIRGHQSFLKLQDKDLVVDFSTQFPTNLMNSILCASLFSDHFEQHISDLSSLSLRLETENGNHGNIIINDAYSFDLDSLKIALNYQYQQYPKGKKLLIASVPEKDIEDNFYKIINNYDLDEVWLIGDSKSHSKTKIFESKEALIESGRLDEIQDTVILIKGYRKDHLEELTLKLEEITHKTWLEIDLSSMRNNIRVFRKRLAPGTNLLAMVKASAYGGGMDRIGKVLENEGIDYLGVAYTEEGVKLRKAGIHTPTLVMNCEKHSFEKLIKNKLEPSIYNDQILEEFIRFLIKKGIKNYPIHLKIETGMNRLGFRQFDLKKVAEKIVSQPEVRVKSVFSHLSASDDPNEEEWTNKQRNIFDQAVGALENALGYGFLRHLYNSNAILHFKQNPYEMARMGIGLYGISDPQHSELEPVLKLKTKITQIRTIEKGESVGYSRAFIAKDPMRIGVLAIGYADGLMRSYSQPGSVFLKGQRAPIIGNICMDMTMIDLSQIDAKEGDDVEIFGDHISVQEVADKTGTIPYEIFTRISDRVKRVYLD
ncbi:MAG: bifunctional UDP-N-acetylmuramoyl-tripeptide:D-alanyl-D-alanine ligase/alanine racemase [Crocinitomicaceae bacterium]|nr:bifunctional UDP-N-acetylmuramoyl-tripeptide:D-alanyl-D-alanine ligase/alanine racemase [Crocinitomicaceae bacterium]